MLGFAMQTVSHSVHGLSFEDVENGLAFLGIVGFIDCGRPRKSPGPLHLVKGIAVTFGEPCLQLTERKGVAVCGLQDSHKRQGAEALRDAR